MSRLQDAHKSCHVDWLSYTILDTPHAATELEAIAHSQRFLEMAFAEHFEKYFVNATWEPAGSMPPYQHGMKSEHGIGYHFGDVPHQHVQLQGRACLALQHDNALLPIASGVIGTVTRMDVAMDFDGSISCDDLRDSVQSKRIKSRSTMTSSSGTTHYIGSRKSERVARAYEYNAPHPRAGVPRLEFQLKKDSAKEFIRQWRANGLNYAAQMILNSFGVHALNIEKHDEKLPASTPHRSKEKTLRWILTQVAPAIQTLIKDGVIKEPEHFFNEHFLPTNYRGND